MSVNYYDGTDFVEVPTVSYYDGSAWQEATVSYWDGSQWVQIFPSGGGGSGTLVDSYEDQNLSEYGGDTSPWSFVTSPGVTDGSYALQNDDVGVIQSTSGLNAYPSQGDTVRHDHHITESGAALGFLLFTQDETSTPNGYMIRPSDASDAFQIYRVDDGSFTLLDEDTSVTFSQGDQLEIDVTPTTDGVDATCSRSGSQIASVSTTDTTYTSGGIGWRSGGATASTVDYVRIV